MKENTPFLNITLLYWEESYKDYVNSESRVSKNGYGIFSKKNLIWYL